MFRFSVQICSRHNSGITGTDGCGWPTFLMSCAENEWPPSDDCNLNNGDCPNERLSVLFDVCNSGLPLWLLRVRWAIGLRVTLPFPPIVDFESIELLSRRLAGNGNKIGGYNYIVASALRLSEILRVNGFYWGFEQFYFCFFIFSTWKLQERYPS